MAGGQWRDYGGIGKLRRLIAEHSSAVEYELIKVGLRLDHLGTPWLTWRDLKVIMKHLPTDSSVNRELNPKTWQWFDLGNQLSAGILNGIAQQLHLKYGRGKFDPPVKPPAEKINNPDRPRKKLQGSTITEMDAWIAKRRAQGKL